MHHFLQPKACPSGYSGESLSATAGLEEATGYVRSKQHGAPPARSAPYTWSPGYIWNISDYLVERVKELQKLDEAAWYNYADQTGGKRDPAKHSLDSLQRFMQCYTAGERLSLKPHEDRLELAWATRAMLRRSVAFKDAWTG